LSFFPFLGQKRAASGVAAGPLVGPMNVVGAGAGCAACCGRWCGVDSGAAGKERWWCGFVDAMEAAEDRHLREEGAAEAAAAAAAGAATSARA
jgi:hypothetical protein